MDSKLEYIKNICASMIFNTSPYIEYDNFLQRSILKFFYNGWYELTIEDESVDVIITKISRLISSSGCSICFEYKNSNQSCNQCNKVVCTACFISILNDAGIYNCPFCRKTYNFGAKTSTQVSDIKNLLSKWT